MRGALTQHRGLAVALSLLIWLVTVVLVVAVFGGGLGSYETSWGETIRRNESYVSVEGQTLTQEDLAHIAGLKNLSYLSLKDCNVGECRLSELEFASDELYSINLSGTTGLWDLSFLSTTAVSYLDLSYCRGVEDLSLINRDELYELRIDGTGVTDLAPLAHSEVGRISFAHTGVSDLTPLAGIAYLYEVDGSYTQVSSLEPLLSCELLREIAFEGCPLNEIAGSFSSQRLKLVNLAKTQVKDLSCLAACSELATLDLGGCARVKDVSWLNVSCYTTLTSLDLGGTGLAADDLGWIRRCSNLEQLTLDGTELDNLDLCKGLDKLEELSALGCGLTDVSGIANCRTLELLLLGFNQLEDIEGMPVPTDEWPQMVLDLSYNRLSSVRDLPAGEYRCLLLQGNDADIGRTIPSSVEVVDLVIPWFSGMDDSRLRDGSLFWQLYLLDTPADRVDGIEAAFGPWRLSCISEDELLQMLERDDMSYGLYLDMSGYVTYAREHGAGDGAGADAGAVDAAEDEAADAEDAA